MTERVQIVGPYGEKGSVAATDLNSVIEAGGRLATDKEVAEQQLAEQYARKSTAEKVGGVASSILAGPIASNALAASGAVAVQPEVEALDKGLASPLAMGLDRVATKAALEATAGKEAGKAYAQHQADLSQAHGGWETTGEVAGMAAMLAGAKPTGLARLAPGLGVTSAGAAVEHAAARGLAGLAARGVGGRAAATALALGARGGVEGALYGAANELTEDMLGDKEVAADRLFAASGMGALYGALGGAAIGGTGSLAKSGLGALARGASRAGRAVTDLAASAESAGARAAADVEGTALGAVDRAKAAGAEALSAVEESGAKALTQASEATGFRSGLAKLAETETQKGLAYEQAWKAVGGGNGLQSTRYAKQVQKYFPNGTKDIGEVAIRHGIVDISTELDPIRAGLKAARTGTAADMLPKVQAAGELVGQKIGALTDASGARIAAKDILGAVEEVGMPYSKMAGFGNVESGVRNYGLDLADKLGIQLNGAVDQSVSIQDLLTQRKALDKLVYQEAKALDPGGRVGALRDLRGKLEGLITNAIDDASGKAKGELAGEYKTLKKDYHALSLLEELTEDTAARQSKAATLGLGEKMALATSLASGNIGAAPVLAIGGKVLRERGNAFAAALLYRMAELGSATKVINAINEKLDTAAAGLLSADRPKRVLPSPNPVDIATRAEKQIAELTSRPERVAERATTVTQGLSQAAPGVGGGVAANLTRALAFLNSKLPPQRAVDPLAPERKRSWNQTDAARFARYVEAAEDPVGVLDDIEHGKVTREGVETLRVLTPTLYRDLQRKTLDSIADTLAKGKSIPYDTRLKLGTLLDIPTDPSLTPKVRTFLQQNVMPPPAAAGSVNAPPSGKARGPIKIPTQHNAFDRLAESGVGRHR